MSRPRFDPNLEALRMCLHNLEGTIARLFDFRLLLPDGALRDRLIDEVRALDCIQAAMATVPFAMARGFQQFQHGYQGPTRYG